MTRTPIKVCFVIMHGGLCIIIIKIDFTSVSPSMGEAKLIAIITMGG